MVITYAKTLNENTHYSWSMFAKCTGKGNFTNKSACRKSMEVNSRQIVKFLKDDNLIYGFICPECGCFTKLDVNIIPPEIKKTCTLIKT